MDETPRLTAPDRWRLGNVAPADGKIHLVNSNSVRTSWLTCLTLLALGLFAACSNEPSSPKNSGHEGSSRRTERGASALAKDMAVTEPTAPVVSRDGIDRNPRHIVIARGDDTAVCNVVIEPYFQSQSNWKASVLRVAPAGTGVSWLFCEGEPSSGIGVISARSSDRQRWTTGQLPIPERNHAGDQTEIMISDDHHASVTYKTLVGERRVDVWTADGGATWSIRTTR